MIRMYFSQKLIASSLAALFLVSALLFFPGRVFAQDDGLTNDLVEKQLKEGVADDLDLLNSFTEGAPKSKRRYIYEEPSMATFSHMYWALGLLDYENKEHIDNFLRINECDIFKNYFSREFEWEEIRKATVKFLKANKDDFPLRFELVLPIRLKDYDLDKKSFAILEEDQIISSRKFETYANDFGRMYCGHSGGELEGYPQGIIAEFSRPITILSVPAPQDVAVAYIREKDAELQKRFANEAASKTQIYNSRKAYIVLQFNIFSHRGIIRLGKNETLQVMAVLEGIEVYADKNRSQLFFSQSYLRGSVSQQINEKFLREFDILSKKHEGEGVFY